MTDRPLTVAALPRDRNPYQQRLYDAMAAEGVVTAYLGELTASRTLNVLLLPWEVRRAARAGTDVVHLHWVWAFALPGASRWAAMRRASELVFDAFLRSTRRSGASLVWTAHNVLPHTAVFPDDVGARRRLAAAADLVLAHDQSTIDELSALGVHPRSYAVVPHGPFDLPPVVRRERAADEPVRLGFLGAVSEYKGIDDFLEAVRRLPAGAASVLVAGEPADAGVEARTRAAAATSTVPVTLMLRRLSDVELAEALGSIDVLVLPYRRVSTSGSAVLGLGAGLPIVIPDLPGLASLPSSAVFRYPHGVEGLAEALDVVVRTPGETLVAMGASGRTASAGNSWTAIGVRTAELFRSLRSARMVARA
jgi:glycosyltransferase involved in cell wall biosynthesis